MAAQNPAADGFAIAVFSFAFTVRDIIQSNDVTEPERKRLMCDLGRLKRRVEFLTLLLKRRQEERRKP